LTSSFTGVEEVDGVLVVEGEEVDGVVVGGVVPNVKVKGCVEVAVVLLVVPNVNLIGSVFVSPCTFSSFSFFSLSFSSFSFSFRIFFSI
jgi:hypothetical protein